MAIVAPRRVVVWAVSILAVIVVLGFAVSLYATRTVQRMTQEWLGASGQADAIDIGWNRVRLTNVLIPRPDGWPGEQAFKASQVDIHPKWTALLSNRIEISAIIVSDFQLTAYRKPAGGVDVLPSLREHARQKNEQTPSAKKRQSQIDLLTFRDGTIDFYDGQISRKPHHIAITAAQAEIGPMHFPGNDQKIQIDIVGDIGGKNGGKISNKGWIVIASRDADIASRLSAVPVAQLAPYLQKGSHLAFEGGRVGLTLAAKVQAQQIHASGTLTLSDLQLADTGLLSLPRRAAIAALQDDNGRATFKYTLHGPLSKPVFQMEDNLSTRVAGGLAGVLGISIEGVARGIGHTAEGIGSALTNLTGGESER